MFADSLIKTSEGYPLEVQDILERSNSNWTFLCQVTDVDSFWVWTRHELIPGLYHVSWYNSQPFDYKEGFVSNREAFLIGLPRLRQIRLKQGES